ncbi:MAG: AcrR family transcriptional regulator [Bradymonadia bacterium]|jgi:AcrR family transcriptional regulator
MNAKTQTPRQKILGHAMRRFAQDGYANTALADVAADSEITRSAVLYHFESKERLRQQVLGDVIDRWKSRLPKLMMTTESGEGRFEAIAWEVVHFFTEDVNRARLVVREMLDRPAEMREALFSELGEFMELVTAALKLGQESGVIRADIEPASAVMQATHLLVGGLASFDVLGVFSGDDDEAFERYVTELVRFARAALFVNP